MCNFFMLFEWRGSGSPRYSIAASRPQVGQWCDEKTTSVSVRYTWRVVWTRLRSTEQTLAGDRRDHYESGIEFTGVTPAQEKALADALATLQAAQAPPQREPSP